MRVSRNRKPPLSPPRTEDEGVMKTPPPSSSRKKSLLRESKSSWPSEVSLTDKGVHSPKERKPRSKKDERNDAQSTKEDTRSRKKSLLKESKSEWPSEVSLTEKDLLTPKERKSRSKKDAQNDTQSTMEESHSHVWEPPTPVTPKEDGEGSKFHDFIEQGDWNTLEKHLKKFNSRYYKNKREQAERQAEEAKAEMERSPETPTGTPTPRRQMRLLKLLPGNISKKLIVDPSEIVSPMVTGNKDGRTPLHLACLRKAPEAVIVELLRQDRKAASVQDNWGQVPLHLAIKSRLHDPILAKIIRGHPNALKTKDIEGRSPLGLAVFLAREKQEKDSPENSEKPFCWTSNPLDKKERSWQFAQEDIWAKANFLLRDLMKRKKSVIPSEHGLILDGLEGGAPPKTINRFVSTADKYLPKDDDLAGSAISLCVDRQYPLDTLEYLVDNCNEKTVMVTDYTQKALSKHYTRGCHPPAPDLVPYGKEVIEWFKTNKDRNQTDETLQDVTPACKEWWETLRYLIFYLAYGKSFKKNKNIAEHHLLHAALAIPSAQPSLIQLLLLTFPPTGMELCPIYKALPIHIACTRWRYDILRSEEDGSVERIIKFFLKKGGTNHVFLRYRGRLPLHQALAVGHSWNFIERFVAKDKMSVGMRDPDSKLFPFQLAALKLPSKNGAMILRHQFPPSEWKHFSTRERKKELSRVTKIQDRLQIGTIFELLRRHPDAVVGRPLIRASTKVIGIKGAGPVSRHYLRWVYHETLTGWKVQPRNVKMLRDSIVNAHISRPLVPWFDQLKNLIWDNCPGDSVLKTEEFLLHCALYNSDTPPLVIELLLQLFPMSAAKPLPGTQTYPLHIAAGTTAYHPQPFEIPSTMGNMDLTLLSYKRAVSITSNGRLPIHICTARGKTWSEIRLLVRVDKSTLLVKDRLTQLTPVQLMASFKSTAPENALRFAAMTEKQTRTMHVDSMSTEDRAALYRDIRAKHELMILSSIYELFRRAPNVLQSTSSDGGIFAASDQSDEVTLSEAKAALGGVSGALERFLQEISPSGSVADLPDLVSPEQRKKPSLGSFLSENGSSPNLFTPRTTRPSLSSLMDSSGKGSRPSLSNFLNGGTGTSSRSLISRNSATFDEYVTPDYDDDNMSSMGHSMSSGSFWLSPGAGDDSVGGSTTPTPMRSPRRGRKSDRMKMKGMLALPDLDNDD